MKGSKYVNLTAEDLFPVLNKVGEGIVQKGGSYARTADPGREVTYTFTPPTPRRDVSFTIYTSIGKSGSARGVGEDAIRIVIHTQVSGRFRAVGESIKIYRTASNKTDDRVGAFIERFIDKIREVYKNVMTMPRCPECGAPMVMRVSSRGNFLGCITFPQCRGTMAA